MEIKSIRSRENARIKKARQLTFKKYRWRNKKFIVENPTTISDALTAGFKFEKIFLTSEFRDKNSEKIKNWQKRNEKGEFFLISQRINKHLSQLDTPSGVVAVYNMSRRDLSAGESVVYLNNLNNPGNLGAILRNCLAFDFRNVVLDINCADLYNPKVLAAAKDSVFKLNIYMDKKGDWLEKNNLPLYVTLPAQGEDWEKLKANKEFCLVLGSESRGIDEEIVKKADKKINIKMRGDAESLGVVSAAAIILYKLNL